MTTSYTPPEDRSPLDHPDPIAVTEGGWWNDAVRLSAQRIKDCRGQQQQIDARLLVLALRQLVYAADMQAKAINRRPGMPAAVHRHLKAARKTFAEALPGVVQARDRLIHFSEHARGVSVSQKRITEQQGSDERTVAREMWYFGDDPTTEEISSGTDYRFSIEEVCRQASMLSQAIWWAGRVYTPASCRHASVWPAATSGEHDRSCARGCPRSRPRPPPFRGRRYPGRRAPTTEDRHRFGG